MRAILVKLLNLKGRKKETYKLIDLSTIPHRHCANSIVHTHTHTHTLESVSSLSHQIESQSSQATHFNSIAGRKLLIWDNTHKNTLWFPYRSWTLSTLISDRVTKRQKERRVGPDLTRPIPTHSHPCQQPQKSHDISFALQTSERIDSSVVLIVVENLVFFYSIFFFVQDKLILITVSF